jgi:hypothetical protein
MPESNYTLDLPESYTVHPAAEVYPLLPKDRMNDLAESIKQHGMHFPIVMTTGADGEALLIDGRNRLAACGIAEVHPTIDWREFEDDDAIRNFIYAASERRDISKGQRAMAAALIFPEGTRYKQGGSNVRTPDIKKTSLYEARTILKYQPDLQEHVMRGAEPMPFSVAYGEAMAAKRVIQAGTERVNQIETHLESIREASEALAEQLESGHIELDEALAQAKEMKRAAHAGRVATSLQLGKIEGLMLALETEESRDVVREIAKNHKDILKQQAYTTPGKMDKDLIDLRLGIDNYLNGA